MNRLSRSLKYSRTSVVASRLFMQMSLSSRCGSPVGGSIRHAIVPPEDEPIVTHRTMAVTICAYLELGLVLGRVDAGLDDQGA